MLASRKKKNWAYRCEEYFKLLYGFKRIFNINCGVKCEQIKMDIIEEQNVRAEEKWLSVLNYQTGRMAVDRTN